MAKQFTVDRARFLAFAAAVAGATSFQACSATDKKETDNAGGADTSAAGKNSMAGAKSDAGEASQAGSSGERDTAGAGGMAGGAPEGGASEGGAPEGGAAGAGDAGAGGAGECSDDVGVATCAGLTTACDPYCNAALLNLKPAAADAAVACLKLDVSSNCDNGYTCLATATAKGCTEDVASACATATSECTSPSAGDPPCAQLLSGLKEAARAEAVSCITEGCYSVYSCAEGLFFE